MHLFNILFAVFLILPAFINGFTVKQQQCLDPLKPYTESKVKTSYFMDIHQIAHSQMDSKMLTCFLRESHPGDKSLTEQLFDVYNKIDEYKRNNFMTFGAPQLEQLKSLGLPIDFESNLKEKIVANNKDNLKNAINIVQKSIANDIIMSRDYEEYKKLIFSTSPKKIEK